MQQKIQPRVALELFRTRKISECKATQIADLSHYEFMDLTQQHDLAWIDYTDDEPESELRKAEALGKTTHERTE